MMNAFKKTATIMALSMFFAVAPMSAQAAFSEIANDTLYWSNGDIIARPGTSWDAAGTSLEYTVYFDDVEEIWKYRYEWSTDHKSLSHIILSLTEDGDLGAFTDDNLLGGTDGGEIKYYGPDDPSNPGIFGDMYGIKFDTDDDGLDAYFEIITDRGPMWGDFYVKGGVEMLAVQSALPQAALPPMSKKHKKLLAKSEAGTLKKKQRKKLAKLEKKYNQTVAMLDMSEEERKALGKKARKRLKKLEKRMTAQSGRRDREKAWMYAYNSGFGEENEIWFYPDGTVANHISNQILVPDSFEGAVPPSAVVPVPAAVWLFGSGLIGLLGVARRRKSV